MDSEKYNRSIALFCPTCGGTIFEFEHGVDETIEIATCAKCGRELPKDELIRENEENEENISEHVKEIGKEVVKDITEDFKKSFKNAFRDSKYIKIK